MTDGFTLTLRVTPNARANTVTGFVTRDDGTTVLAIRVTAPPDKGRANKAVIALLAKALGVPRSKIAITAGETARTKTVSIAANKADLSDRLDALSH